MDDGIHIKLSLDKVIIKLSHDDTMSNISIQAIGNLTTEIPTPPITHPSLSYNTPELSKFY